MGVKNHVYEKSVVEDFVTEWSSEFFRLVAVLVENEQIVIIVIISIVIIISLSSSSSSSSSSLSSKEM